MWGSWCNGRIANAIDVEESSSWNATETMEQGINIEKEAKEAKEARGARGARGAFIHLSLKLLRAVTPSGAANGDPGRYLCVHIMKVC